MDDEKEPISLGEAVKRLPDGDMVHTFRQGGPCLIGADWGARQPDCCDG